MCTQHLIWCSCGHGEFLPIERCPSAIALGYCWTIVHGDHGIVLEPECSYCQAGLNATRPLQALARPEGTVKEMLEKASKETGIMPELKGTSRGRVAGDDRSMIAEVGSVADRWAESPEDKACEARAEDTAQEVDSAFDFAQDLWQYE